MKKQNEKEEIQSRREFFKNAAKGALPILGLVMLNSPIFANTLQTVGKTPSGCNRDGCSSFCSHGCTKGCEGGCDQSCKDDCNRSCSESCWDECRGSCSRSCRNTCEGKCSGFCTTLAY